MQTPYFLGHSLAITATRFPVSGDSQNVLAENYHAAWAVVCDWQGKPVWSTCDALEMTTFIRSAAKPFQALPLLDFCEEQKGEKSGLLSSEDLAIACASHSASHRHVHCVEVLLGKAGFTPDALQCGADWPGDMASRRALQAQGRMPEKIHNNCSGKHAGMLFCCRQNGWDSARYLDAEHPLQQRILDGVKHWGELTDIPLAVDGCGAPVFYLPLVTMARLYTYLGYENTFKPLRDAMLMYPDLVGGEGRVDTSIMQASRGSLLAKVGADGVLCVSFSERGQGLALKVADGSASIRNLALVHLLRALGWLDDVAWEDSRLAAYRENRRFNTLGQVIGDYRMDGLPNHPI